MKPKKLISTILLAGVLFTQNAISKNLNIMLIGDSGVGKSQMANMMHALLNNYNQKVNDPSEYTQYFKNLKKNSIEILNKLQIPQLFTVGNKTKSCTIDFSDQTIDMNNMPGTYDSITISDIPGFNDNRDSMRITVDNNIFNKLIKSINEQTEENKKIIVHLSEAYNDQKTNNFIKLDDHSNVFGIRSPMALSMIESDSENEMSDEDTKSKNQNVYKMARKALNDIFKAINSNQISKINVDTIKSIGQLSYQGKQSFGVNEWYAYYLNNIKSEGTTGFLDKVFDGLIESLSSPYDSQSLKKIWFDNLNKQQIKESDWFKGFTSALSKDMVAHITDNINTRNLYTHYIREWIYHLHNPSW